MDVLVHRVVFILSVIITLLILGRVIGIAMDTSCTITMRVKEYFNRQPSTACLTKTLTIKDDARVPPVLQEEAYRCLSTYAHHPRESLGNAKYCIPCARLTLPRAYTFEEVRDALSQPINGHAFLTTYAERQSTYGNVHVKDILLQSDAELAHAPGNPQSWESEHWQILFIQDPQWQFWNTNLKKIMLKGVNAYKVWEGVIILPTTLDPAIVKEYCPETLPVGRVVNG